MQSVQFAVSQRVVHQARPRKALELCEPCARYMARRRSTACASLASDSGAVRAESTQEPTEYSLTLRKPVGIVFAQKPSGGPVFVEEVTPGGAADRTGMVRAGDELARCSAVVLKAGKDGQYEAEGYGQRPYDNWSRIMFDCTGQEFKTVMSALKSNNERWGIMDVTLVLRRPQASHLQSTS